MKIIAQKLADWQPCHRPRTVIITQGKNPIIVAYTNERLPMETYTVPVLNDDEIVDTNGAGDAFVGGFIAYRLACKPMAECIKAATFAAQEVIKQSGCVFPKENPMKLV
ncbi:hypothetical protein BLA29_013865 [Euroglyphus maynei]|uniref:Adenosine kinase n=1 Tax=Euroglyphus maynei TaxID=6958 RepID=A0A1Y3B7S6_EURMA|nr:hypothetical protein BLA29_013865 [Euroglyphus maynei]